MTEASSLYAPLETCAAAFNDLQQALTDPDGGPRIAAIRVALEAAAQNVSEARSATAVERDELATLYRGLLAAGRIVDDLAENAARRKHATGGEHAGHEAGPV
ncbi:hypothetical protein [Cupriavidus sp. UYPR2.512]|uniref:hypothetical protein n=1 Tax=Cupriavidus sp. UYPR2.512 TaxID=1080187 RepID=UPI00037EF1C7|nr:hypothetical protein [Cupriavidus sp. UYPR2.512]